MKRFSLYCGIAALAAAALVLCGCPPEAEEETVVDSRLVGEWENNETPETDAYRTFSIQKDGSFNVSMSPGGAPGGRGTVAGKLIPEGSEYIINNMRETTNKDWGDAVSFYNGTYVQIVFAEGNQSFDLKCNDDPTVYAFFGGNYKRRQQ
jgi:hypothetical protein